MKNTPSEHGSITKNKTSHSKKLGSDPPRISQEGRCLKYYPNLDGMVKRYQETVHPVSLIRMASLGLKAQITELLLKHKAEKSSSKSITWHTPGLF